VEELHLRAAWQGAVGDAHDARREDHVAGGARSVEARSEPGRDRGVVDGDPGLRGVTSVQKGARGALEPGAQREAPAATRAPGGREAAVRARARARELAPAGAILLLDHDSPPGIAARHRAAQPLVAPHERPAAG